MARKAKANNSTVNEDLLNDIMRRHDVLDDDLNQAKGAFLRDCKEIAGEKKDLFKEAKDRGLNTKVLRKNIARRKKLREADAIRDSLDAEYFADFDAYAAVIEGGVKPAPQKAAESAQQKDAEALEDFENGAYQ